MIDIWNGRTVEITHRPKELAEMNKEGNVTRAAIKSNMTLSRFLEENDPSEEWETAPDGTRLDAFGRQMKHLGIITQTDPTRGVNSDTLGDFVRKGGRPYLHEFCSRRWKEARFGQPANPYSGGHIKTISGRSIFTSADEGLGSVWRPIFENARERSTNIEAAIPLSTLMAAETGITQSMYRGAYLDQPDPQDVRKYRVGEMAEIPLTKIEVSEYENSIYKYGLGFALSYEQARRQPLDKISFFIQKVAMQDEVDKVEHAMSVAISGDGNNNAATSYNLTTLDPAATIGTITVKAWLAFKAKFLNAYSMNLAFARSADWLDIQTLSFSNANTMFYQTAGQFGSINNINRNFDASVGLGLLETIPVDKIVGMDSRFALGHVFEIGSQINEADKFITSQTDVVVMTENEGFEVLDSMATRVLNLAA